LKPRSVGCGRTRCSVPPGLTAGSGLKHHGSRAHAILSRSSRPDRRERIETTYRRWYGRHGRVPPGLTAGSGLKPFECRMSRGDVKFLPA